MKVRLLFATIVLAAASLLAQTSSTGKVEKPLTLDIDAWVGQRFIFLPRTRDIQHYGYQSFDPHLPYAVSVGKTITVIAVSKAIYPEVRFRTEKGDEVIATAFGGTVNDIAPLRDLEYARGRWIGKSLWLRTNELVTFNEDTQKFGSVRLGRTAHVKVKDVVAGWFAHQPIRFILLSDDGREGTVDVQLSGTNVSNLLRGESQFSEFFDEVDPHQQHKDWPAPVWKAIADESVFVNMTAEQARTSWGPPKTITPTVVQNQKTDRWDYAHGKYFLVSNGVVSAVQN